jgi:hypothetical protein
MKTYKVIEKNIALGHNEEVGYYTVDASALNQFDASQQIAKKLSILASIKEVGMLTGSDFYFQLDSVIGTHYMCYLQPDTNKFNYASINLNHEFKMLIDGIEYNIDNAIVLHVVLDDNGTIEYKLDEAYPMDITGYLGTGLTLEEQQSIELQIDEDETLAAEYAKRVLEAIEDYNKIMTKAKYQGNYQHKPKGV